MRFFLPILFSFASATASAQNVQFSATLDQPNNVVGWSVSTSVGSVNVSPSTFRLGGKIQLELDSTTGPYTLGALNGSLAFTVPGTISGEIPNPIPFFPPLASFDLENLEFAMLSAPFVIDPVTGDFTTDIELYVTSGTMSMSGLLGNSTESVAGLTAIQPGTVGRVTESNGVVNLWFDMNMQVVLDDPSTGVTSTVTFTGDIDAYANTSEANAFHLDVSYPLAAGTNNIVSFKNATPNGTVHLAGTGRGHGNVYVAQLATTLNLASPVRLDSTVANGAGAGQFNIFVPAGYVGVSVLMQAIEYGKVTNVAGTFIF